MENPRTLNDFVEFLRLLDDAGIAYVVIGGCAVGAYAMLRGEAVFSQDLDIYVAADELSHLLAWAQQQGIVIEKRPQPRAVQVAVLRYHDQEINLLTESSGLPSFDEAAREAREFRLASGDGLEVPLADPFALLANKLAVHREKDRPHVAVLRSFIEEEIVAAFQDESNPRRRIAPAKRLLRLLGAQELSLSLGRQLIASARAPADFRFLANHIPSELWKELFARSPAELRDELQNIADKRNAE